LNQDNIGLHGLGLFPKPFLDKSASASSTPCDKNIRDEITIRSEVSRIIAEWKRK
jgi:hypothetical protein